MPTAAAWAPSPEMDSPANGPGVGAWCAQSAPELECNRVSSERRRDRMISRSRSHQPRLQERPRSRSRARSSGNSQYGSTDQYGLCIAGTSRSRSSEPSISAARTRSLPFVNAIVSSSLVVRPHLDVQLVLLDALHLPVVVALNFGLQVGHRVPLALLGG